MHMIIVRLTKQPRRVSVHDNNLQQVCRIYLSMSPDWTFLVDSQSAAGGTSKNLVLRRRPHLVGSRGIPL
jgi:hypothetical protein